MPHVTVPALAGLAAAGATLAMLLRPTFGLYALGGVGLVASLAAAGMAVFVVMTPRDVAVREWLRAPATALAMVAFAAALLSVPFDIMTIAGDGLRGLG